MRIVVAGDGETATRIAELLVHDHELSVIAREEPTARLGQLDLRVVRGSSTSATALREAGTKDADFFIAASENDERNIVACLAADRLGALRKVCFLAVPRGAHFELTDDASLADSILWVDQIIRPAEQLAEEIMRIITVPGALDVRSFHGGRVRLLKCRVPSNCSLAGQALQKATLPGNIRLALIQRGDDFFIPVGSTEIQDGDRITALGTPKGVRDLHRKILGGPTLQLGRHHAIICGGGTVGSVVAKGLLQEGWRVKVIEEDKERCEELAAELDCLVLHGDATDADLLDQERIATAEALVAVTNNDEGNLLVSLLAKNQDVPRIITRADRPKNARLFERVGIDVVLTARGAAVRTVVNEIVQADTKHLADLEHGTFSVLELELPPGFQTTLLCDLAPPSLTNVGAILRGRTTIIPSGGDELRPRDRILIIGSNDELDNIRDYFLRERTGGTGAD